MQEKKLEEPITSFLKLINEESTFKKMIQVSTSRKSMRRAISRLYPQLQTMVDLQRNAGTARN
jgi:hypothetical protein